MQIWRLTISDKGSFFHTQQIHWAVVPSILKGIAVPRHTPEIDNALYLTQQSQEGYHLMQDLAEQVPRVDGLFILVRSCHLEMRIQKLKGLLTLF